MNVKKLLFLFFILFLQNLNANIYNITGNYESLKKQPVPKIKRWQKNMVKMAQNNQKNIVINGPTNQKVVYLTFDDGPNPQTTPYILDVLKKYNAKASFFFVGNQIEKNEQLVIQAHKEGHAVLNHSWSHPRLSKLQPELVKQEIKKTENYINSLTGKRSLLIRPPFGDITAKTVQILKNLKYKFIIWSLDSFDWCNITKDEIVKNVVQNIRPGEIILMHSKIETKKALPRIIKKLKEKGYRFETVDNIS